ncbi:EF-hand domain-containing protein [Streptomyces sp. NPDC058461]|uniref:EF-hand domain-containing protein n=1 Tax=Streptomyces sp. NPDC058461 TaxID=3346509 RepID=UPI003660CDD8
MPTTEATDRVRLVFSLFDADGNGFIEPADFELMGSRVVEAAPKAGDPARQRLLAAFHGDGDGRISPEEFTAVVLDPGRFDATVAEFADALAGIGDPDGDGFVERPDFVALMTAIGFERPNIDALFDAFDPVGSGRVAVAVWADGIRDYYRPDKAGIPGDHLTAATAQ